MQLSSEEGFLEIAVKARKRPFKTAVVIVSNLIKNISFILLVCPIKLEVKCYDYFSGIEQSTGHVQVIIKNPVFCMYGSFLTIFV